MEKILYPGSVHNHTEYSNIRLLDCTNHIPDLMKSAESLGHSLLAFTDHDFVGSFVQIEKAMKDHPNLKVIRGNEIYLCRNGLNSDNFIAGVDKYYHFILLAKDLVGVHQLYEISTRAWNRSYMGRGLRRVPTYYQDLFDIIGANPGHIVGSTACLGGCVATQLLKSKTDSMLNDKIINWLTIMNDLFGQGNFYLEMQPSNNADQIYVNKRLLQLSHQLNIPYIITTDSHYLTKADRPIHKAYLNAKNGEREVDDFYATTYMMGTEELESYFSYFTEDDLQEAYHNILHIGDMCEDYSVLKPLKIPELMWRPVVSYEMEYDYWFNLMPTLRNFYQSTYRSDRYLVDALIAGIKSHDDLQNEEAYAALEDNLQRTWESSEVNKARWSAYYLNLQRNIDECWNAGTIVGPARGSGGGFVLLYCLDVIQMNCLREPTPMYPWRFLNPARVSVLNQYQARNFVNIPMVWLMTINR